MARPFESFEFMNRDRDVRKLEGLSLRSIFAYLLSMIFILGAGTGITAYAYFHNAKIVSSQEDYLSFPSGHASLGFAITAGSAMVCHWRHYWTEPYVWGTGIALSVSTEYLRMAADKHWLSDVLVGGFVGIGAGLLIPSLMRRDVKIDAFEGQMSGHGRRVSRLA